MCNFVHHFGMTGRLLLEGKLSENDIRAVEQHFCKVNGCKVKELVVREERRSGGLKT